MSVWDRYNRPELQPLPEQWMEERAPYILTDACRRHGSQNAAIILSDTRRAAYGRRRWVAPQSEGSKS